MTTRYYGNREGDYATQSVEIKGKKGCLEELIIELNLV